MGLEYGFFGSRFMTLSICSLCTHTIERADSYYLKYLIAVDTTSPMEVPALSVEDELVLICAHVAKHL